MIAVENKKLFVPSIFGMGIRLAILCVSSEILSLIYSKKDIYMGESFQDYS